MQEVSTIAVVESPARALPESGWWRAVLRVIWGTPLIGRYIVVSGVIGLPASILQLWVLIQLYQLAVGGDVGPLALNALWFVNFEIGLLRNFAMHCAFTWRSAPTWSRVRHAHVAASGAIIIDLIAFNVVVLTTGIIPLAQLFGAGSGFLFNFAYNSLKTFARPGHEQNEGGIA